VLRADERQEMRAEVEEIVMLGGKTGNILLMNCKNGYRHGRQASVTMIVYSGEP